MRGKTRKLIRLFSTASGTAAERDEVKAELLRRWHTNPRDQAATDFFGARPPFERFKPLDPLAERPAYNPTPPPRVTVRLKDGTAQTIQVGV